VRSPLVSVGLPVYNAEESIEGVVRSVLGQDHDNLELLISDNASTDGTQEVCRSLADADERIIYVRQAHNMGLLPNFVFTMARSRGVFFRWIGDDDWISADCVSQGVAAFGERPDAVLATSVLEYTSPEGKVSTNHAYDGAALASDDPVARLEGILDALNGDTFVVDPLYALMRRDVVVRIPRPNMFQEDQFFATKLALAGPWAHVPLVLGGRHFGSPPAVAAARRLGVPTWQVRVRTSLLCRAVLQEVGRAGLDQEQRQRAYGVVARFYVRRQARISRLRVRRARALLAKSPTAEAPAEAR
jgi:glycosyltransferase involved in cell wall biosynthesis